MSAGVERSGKQAEVIIPSRDLVLVRLGLTLAYDGTWDVEEFIEHVLEAIPVNRD